MGGILNIDQLMEQLRLKAGSPAAPGAQSRFMQSLKTLGPKTEEIIKRAAATLEYANLVSNGGDFQVEQIKQWLNIALGVDPIDVSSVFTRIDSAPFAGPTGERLDWFNTQEGYLRAHEEKTAGTVYGKLETDKKTVLPKKTKMLLDPTYEFVEKSVVADPTGRNLLAWFGILYRNDLTNLIWNGDEDSTNPALSIYDGFIKKAKDSVHYPDVHRANTTGWATLSTDVSKMEDILWALFQSIASFRDGVFLDMPLVIKMSKLNMARYWKYMKDIGSGTTEQGVVSTQTGQLVARDSYAGIPIEVEPKFPNTSIIVTLNKNLAFRYVKSLLIESDKDINAQNWLFVLSNEHNCEIAYEPALWIDYAA
jgi:hypothetical protein